MPTASSFGATPPPCTPIEESWQAGVDLSLAVLKRNPGEHRSRLLHVTKLLRKDVNPLADLIAQSVADRLDLLAFPDKQLLYELFPGLGEDREPLLASFLECYLLALGIGLATTAARGG